MIKLLIYLINLVKYAFSFIPKRIKIEKYKLGKAYSALTYRGMGRVPLWTMFWIGTHILTVKYRDIRIYKLKKKLNWL